ncbi:MAG TPA: hypothetical protein VMW42_02410 [Desulfatiglandales bacterium]|nr:hypothetical protein [Desulfatiglandales bacterium]
MRYSKGGRLFLAFLIFFTCFSLIVGCDSGKKTVDELTGNRAVKQYHKSKKDLGKIADQQAERYKNLPGDEGQQEENQ